MTKVVGVFFVLVLALCCLAYANHQSDVKVDKNGIAAEVSVHLPQMQAALNNLSQTQHKLMIYKLEQSHDWRVQQALTVLDLEYHQKSEFHGPTVPPPPDCDPSGSGCGPTCPCDWWDIGCIWANWDIC